MKKEIIYYRESAVQSIVSDITTFALLGLLFAFNHHYMGDSTVTAFFFFIVFLMITFAKGATRGKRFSDKETLLKHINETL